VKVNKKSSHFQIFFDCAGLC